MQTNAKKDWKWVVNDWQSLFFSVRDQTLNLNKDEYKEKSDKKTKKQGDDNRVKEMSQGKAKMKNKTKNDEAR